MKKNQKQIPNDDAWKNFKMEDYTKDHLQSAITFLRMCLSKPNIFAALVAALEDHRTHLVQLEEDAKHLQKAEIDAEKLQEIKAK